MTLSTNSFDEFHCQAADNFDTKEENESSKYFYHKILNIYLIKFPRSLNDVRLRVFIFGIRKIITMFPLTCDDLRPWAKAAPLLLSLFLRTVATCFLSLKARVAVSSQLQISRTFRLLLHLTGAVDSCTQWPGVQTVVKPVPWPDTALGGAQLQTRARRAGVKSSVTELAPHPGDKTRQKQGYQEVLRQ